MRQGVRGPLKAVICYPEAIDSQQVDLRRSGQRIWLSITALFTGFIGVWTSQTASTKNSDNNEFENGEYLYKGSGLYNHATNKWDDGLDPGGIYDVEID